MTAASPQSRLGWLSMHLETRQSQLALQVSASLCAGLPQVIRMVRELDAEPTAINTALDASFTAAEGPRVPGALRRF